MATIQEPQLAEREPIRTVLEARLVMQRAIGRELSEDAATELGFDLLEFLAALTGDTNDCRESS